MEVLNQFYAALGVSQFYIDSPQLKGKKVSYGGSYESFIHCHCLLTSLCNVIERFHATREVDE